MMEKRRFLPIAAIAAVALVAAACSSGSDDTATVAPPVVTEPSPAEQLAAAQQTAEAAQIAVDTATTPEQISAAYAALATAQGQLSAAANIPENQIAALTAQLEQLRMDLQDVQMLAQQRATVGDALIAAQNAVNALSATSSDADADAAATAVTAAQAALAGATALPADDSLRTSVMAVANLLANAQLARTVHSQQGMVDAALMTAQMAVVGLSNASTDADVTEAGDAVMAAQAALATADALPADDSRHMSVQDASDEFIAAVTTRTAHMETGDIQGLISAAQMAVSDLNKVSSSGTAVAGARTAVNAVTAAIAAATALTDEQKTALSGMISMAGTDLMAIEDYRAMPAGQLAVADAAIARANALVAALTTSSTADEAAAAYGALAEAQGALHAATNLPANVIADLRSKLQAVRGQLTDAQTVTAAVTGATTLVAGVNNESPAENVEAARTKLDDAKAALASAVNLTDSDRANLQGAINSLENTLSAIETVVAARPDPAVVKANTAVANTMEKVLESWTIKYGLGGKGAYGIEISRPRTGTVIEITDTALNGDDDPKFMQTTDLVGGRTMHTRAMEADGDGNVVEEVVVVSTDIDAPKAVAFAKVTGQTLDVDLDDTVDADSDGNKKNDFTALKITDNLLPKIISSAFTAGGSAVLSFVADDENTLEKDEAFETAGTFNGAMGTYRCNAGNDAKCTVELNAKGELTAIGNDWVFTPVAGAKSDVPDADFLHYGFWLKKTTDKDGVLTYNEVETFADSEVAASGKTYDVKGSATYKGGATGVYVHSVSASDGTRVSASSGHFTADAELTATFEQVKVDNKGTIAQNLLNTVTGMIDNFALSGGEENGWSVNLKGDITSTGMVTSLDGATGGGDPGKWAATFHGSVAKVDHDMDKDTPDIFPQPSAVVGEFDANFSNGSVAGAFGARKQ